MIVAIEGPSAVGKTTWCRAHYPGNIVEAPPENLDAPDLFADPFEVANFWVDYNSKLWQTALRIEKEKGLAICDGDPFHLFFSWSFWKAGVLPSDLFEAELPLYRRAVQEGRVGFADLILWREAPIDELRRRAKSDTTRRRRGHELYLSQVPFMKAWFAACEKTLPGTVREWHEHFRIEDVGSSPASPRRYDATAFDQMMNTLD